MLEEILKKLTSKEVKKLTTKKPDEDFIPYVCHYNSNTIITKNGELLQIIRITGLNGDTMASSLIELRDAIRDAIYDNVKNTDFAFWFHTIRRKKDITPTGQYEDFLSNTINNEWAKKNDWKNQYVNELYITIITEGLESSVSDFQTFFKTFSYKSTRNIHSEHLEKSHKKLNEVSQKILVEIEDHGAKLLGIKDWEGVLYSEPVRFFGKITNLYEERYPLAANDISSDLASHKIAFGKREIEVAGKENKNFAAILSIKEYHEVSIESLDKILQLPFEFIITQSFDFFFHKKDLEDYFYQDKILKISEDEDFRQIGGIANFMESNTNSKTDYGKLQSSLMIISNNREELEKDIAMAVDKFSALGFILIREDIFLEHCFWAQLPANFSFLRRQKIINTLRIGGFAALHSFPLGSLAGNHWGPAVTALKTVLNTPYFFNFHDQNCGHTLIIGPKNYGKTTITNFLLLQARKFNNKIFYFDFNNSSKCLVKCLKGNYHKATKDIEDAEFLQMNPLLLENNEENIIFLNKWLKQLVVFLKGDVEESEFIASQEIIRKVLANKSSNFLTLFDALRSEKTKTIHQKLKIWGSGKLAYIFGSQDEINWNNPINGFNFDEIIDKKPILIPTIFYLLHKIETNLDGDPAIIVFDETYEFLDNPLFSTELENILQRLKEKNCMVIFNVTDNKNIAQSAITKIITNSVSTEFYTANKEAEDYYLTSLDLNEEEFEVIKFMNQKSYHFLLKHNNDSLIIDFNLSFLEEMLSVLSCDEIISAAMEEMLEEQRHEEPANWIPELLAIVKEFKTQQKAELAEQQRQEVEKLKQQKEKDEE